MKGALEVSIGFIIIMVISALVLIFALSWLGGMWKQMTQISTYMTGQAVKQMTDSLRGGDDVILTTLPYSAEGVTIPKNSITSFKIGVKRTTLAESLGGTSWSNPNQQGSGIFSLCIGKLDSQNCNYGSQVQGATDIKFTYPQNLRITERGGIQMVDGDMSLGTNAGSDSAIQGFRIYVCTSNSCTGLADSKLFGYTDFIVHIE
jgi:hypothetical protein